MRLVHCVVFCEVAKSWMTPRGYGPDGGGLFDAGHDSHRTAAVDAGGHVDVEHTLEALGPGHRTATLGGGAVVGGRGAISQRGIGAGRDPRASASLETIGKYRIDFGVGYLDPIEPGVD